MDWERFRKHSGHIDLKAAFSYLSVKLSYEVSDGAVKIAKDYLDLVEENQPIVSRQAASIAVSTALYLCILSSKIVEDVVRNVLKKLVDEDLCDV